MRLSEIKAEEYRERIAQACDFLEGHSREMIVAVEEEMRKAAEKLDFEKAAELRNMLEDLRRTTKPMRRFTRHSLPSTIDPLRDLQALGEALQLTRLPFVMECFDISNISTTHVVASMVCFRDGVPDKDCYRRYRIRTVQGQDDFASMAEVIRRRYSRVLLGIAESGQRGSISETGDRKPESDMEAIVLTAPEYSQESAQEIAERVTSVPFSKFEIRRNAACPANEAGLSNPKFVSVRLPDLIIVDGGKGQLSAACRELQRLGLHELPIIGLAKEFEEIYRPGRGLPLLLPTDSGALRLLQRIRDEAHRFANTYHQLLMKKRVGESILDDCPGVSQNRKNLLLRKFGSVNRLRKATVEQIAAVQGIGPKLAEEIHRFLQLH
jgi:excinuclease ABC subunit C